MPDELTDVGVITRELESAAEALNEELLAAEASVNALGLGVTGEVPLYPSAAQGPQLGYGKHDSEWILYMREAREAARVPVTKSSKAVRIQASYRLDDLLDQLLVRAKSHIFDLEMSRKRTQQFNERVRKLVDNTDQP